MPRIDSAEFQRRFEESRREALREPVEIARHGQRELVLMSADHYDWLKAAARRAHRTSEAADVVIAAIERSEMDPRHEELDGLLT